MKKPALLLLSNGKTFRGRIFGAGGTNGGEVCFNTSMSGYQEVLTDPSYSGQLVTMTAPQIGNYGVNQDDVESGKIQVAGFIVREASSRYSNFRASGSLDEYLDEQGIVGIQGIDTRALTRILRSEGAMNGIISSEILDPAELKVQLAKVRDMSGSDLAKEVTCDSGWDWHEKGKKTKHKYRVIALDFGVKWNILRLLDSHGCSVSVMPANTPADQLLELQPDGIFLSNGPGDPAAVSYAVESVKNLLGKIPLFGICLGHQILALALGAETFKLKFGHRGANHPVKNVLTDTVEITSQNHGFAVDPKTLPKNTEITHWNLNDDTLEGFRCKNIPAFSVQYHPEASPGPHDSSYLFNDFISLMDQHAKAD